ncbi:MAG: flagellin FliC [Deltaproteobacteria bacterium]|nr:flagellin FliC [Deltaproteobacteria bacterium]
MVMSIRTNVSSLTAQRNLSMNQRMLDSSLSKLSSGYRISSAADDAAGLGVSTNLVAQRKSYAQAARNGNDGLSVVQTAESALNETANILTRMRELAMQSASDGISNTERAYIQEEADALVAELDRIDNVTEFNGTVLFGAPAVLSFQVGIRDTANDFLTIDTTAMNVDSASLGVNGLDLATDAATSRAQLAGIDIALNQISTYRAQLGASANRISSVLNTIAVAMEQVTASNSRIMDVDVAEETSTMSSAQVLMQAGVSTLAQANQAPQIALKLLG